MICPALVKPMHRAVVSHMSWEAILTALSPLLPTNCPTTIMSTMLYAVWSRVENMKGRAKRMSFLGTLPTVRS